MPTALSPGGYVRQGQRSNSPPRSVNVQVAVRCRPINDREKSHGERTILTCNESRREVHFAAPSAVRKTGASHSSAASGGKKVFTYDQVYGPDATQQDVYEGLVEPIVEEVLQGYNCTVFAYGQTGTGKTHTMEGRRDDDMIGVAERRLAANAGIIPRSVKQIFDHLRNLTDEHSVRVSHLELYNEQLTDLLGTQELAGEPLRVYEDAQKGTFVQGLEDVMVRSEDDIYAVLDRSAMKRKTAETLMNKYSSRSHSVFSITIHIKESTPEGADLLKVGKLNLVDLAGSENVGRSGAVKGRAREAGNINQSLLTLGRVITALVDRHPHVPYRDSKLTRLLQESLGGRNKTCVIATVTPATGSFEETASTLDYAYRAKSIKNRPTVNQMIAKHVLLKEYTEEISRLKRELDATRSKNGVYLPPDEFAKLQLIGNQQRDAISQLSTQSEEYERRLAAQKEKLEKTQDALARDQRLLSDTRESLVATTTELKATKEELVVTTQQKEENAMLVRNHVETERTLHGHGIGLQQNLATSIADVNSLHTRVSVKDDLERKNIANLVTLKETVAGGIYNLGDIVEKHKIEHQSLVESSAATLEKLAEELELGLKMMKERIGHFSNDLLSQTDSDAKDEHGSMASFAVSIRNTVGSLLENVSTHSDLLDNKQMQVLAASKDASAVFQKNKDSVSSIKALLKQFSAAQQSQLDALASEQVKLLAALNDQVGEHISQQTALLDNYKTLSKQESESEVASMRDMKAEIIRNLTSSLDGLIDETAERAARRNERFSRCSEDVVKNSRSIADSVKGARDAISSKVHVAHNGVKERSSQLNEEFDIQHQQHSQNTDQGNALLGSLEENIASIYTSFQDCSQQTKEKIKETEGLVAGLRTHRDAARDVHHEKIKSLVNGTQEKISEASEMTSKSTGEQKEALSSSLESVQDLVRASEDNMKTVISSVYETVKGHDLVLDEDRENIPENRMWPPFETLPTTKAHSVIVTEMRRCRGLGDVPREDFGHFVVDAAESDGSSCMDKSDCSHDNECETSEAQSTSEDNVREDEAAPKSEELNPEEVSREELPDSASLEGSPSVDVETTILCDATNRRSRTRGKKKLEHVIRKKPSALPAPRTRSNGRRLGN